MSFAQYKTYKIWPISLTTFSNIHILPASAYASGIGNFWSIYLGVNILIPFLYVVSNGKCSAKSIKN